MSTFAIGQRWISEPEPELGLGTVMETGEGRVQVLYPATSEVRVYTEENAPFVSSMDSTVRELPS